MACVAALVAAGCRASVPVPTPEPVATDRCLLDTGDPGAPRELVVAMVRPEDTAIVARTRPEPLIRLDCTAAAIPGAAESWVPDSSRRTWTFVLARSALDLTAGSAAAEWRTRPAAATTLRQAGVVSVVALDDRRLVVTLDRASDSVPRFFADPSLGLITDSLPSVGTTFLGRRPASGDPRDALDAGADILRTGDPALLEYARSRGEYTVQPLPWSRTYVLIIPRGRDELQSLIPADSAGFRADLARDAVRTEARAAEPPFWWESAGPCPAEPPLPASRNVGPDAVVHASEDSVARALAHRLVALSERQTMATSAFPARLMAQALRYGVSPAYVVAVPRTALVPCREMAGWPAGATVVPLIDTRMSAIVRRGVPPLAVEFDGSLRAVDAP